VSTLRCIVAYPLTLLVIGCAMVVAAALLASQLMRLLPYDRSSPLAAMAGLVVAAASLLAYKAFKRWVERSPDAELARKGAARELALGLVGGFLLFSLMTGVVWLLGGIEVTGLRGWGHFWPMLGIAIYSGLFEELLFRGLALRLLEPLIGSWRALSATSALFGGAHLLNPDANLFAALAIALEAGVLLGGAYLLTRRLWLCVGIHAAWNFTQGWVFSLPVSGGEAPLGLLVTRRAGPDWLTGGDFGLEASLVAMVVATIAGSVMLAFAVRSGKLIAPAWVRT
jgi:membrane protease YdiL (CAAX protease family)